ncbi:MAG: Uncharacterised protein [Prochlorococcus marinus str. MIT 9215]|nr:MAG: Uncharacterised protein [Prochlorococcus marinus str. MIT 9215]
MTKQGKSSEIVFIDAKLSVFLTSRIGRPGRLPFACLKIELLLVGSKGFGTYNLLVLEELDWLIGPDCLLIGIACL